MSLEPDAPVPERTLSGAAWIAAATWIDAPSPGEP